MIEINIRWLLFQVDEREGNMNNKNLNSNKKK